MKHTLIQTIADERQAETFSGCGRGPSPAARRAASAPPIFVNGVSIPETTIAQEAQNHGAASGNEARAAAARALVIRELLLQRARHLELTPQPARDAQGREETSEEALVRQVLELEVAPAEPSVAECKRVYSGASARFAVPEFYEASHILFAPEAEETAGWTAAYERAVGAIRALLAHEEFAAWARMFSACPSASEGGSLGQLRRGDLAGEVEAVLLTLNEGQIGAEPVRTRHGWHVIRLDRRVPARRLPFEAVERIIAGSLRTRAWAAASARYVAALAASAQIEGLALSLGAPA